MDGEIGSWFLTRNTIADHKNEQTHVREQNVGQNLPEGLPLLDIQLVLFPHGVRF